MLENVVLQLFYKYSPPLNDFYDAGFCQKAILFLNCFYLDKLYYNKG